MHGIIFSELKKYVDIKFGGSTWNDLLDESGVSSRVYAPVKIYPDQDIAALVSAASRMTTIPVPDILEDFGQFIVPDLIKVYGHLSKPEWKTLDFIEHTEETIHRVVRLKTPGADPPALQCNRLSPDEIVLIYSSPRKMCSLAKGIAKGVARHYNEQIIMTETACMLQGSSRCEISIKLVK